jgi:hypothetical protein
MPLFGRIAIDDPDLKLLVGRRRVLASARCPEGQVVGLAESLLHPDAGQWREVAWHEVERGGWDVDTRVLRWTTVDGRSTALPLTDTGRLPDLFNERVTASIACVRTIQLAGKGQAVITARRNLADSTAPLIWRVSPGKGILPEQVDADPLVALEVERLRSEYDLN